MAHPWFEFLWFALAYPASLVAAVAVGYAVAEVQYRRRGRVWKPSGIESALITVFGLLLSFTLLSSNNAYKERTALVHQSAGAAAELYRESQLLPAPVHATVRAFTRQFLALELGAHRPGQARGPGHIRALAGLYQRAWQQLRDSLRGPAPRAADLRQLLPAFNRLSAATERLHYANQERTPASIMALLLVSSWAIGVLVGFTNSAQEARHYFVPALFIVISALTVQAIRDLDNPDLGVIRPSYGNLQDVQRAIEQEPPGAPPH